MVKRKALNPQQVTGEVRRERSWNLGDQQPDNVQQLPSINAQILDLLDDGIDQDEEPANAKRKKGRKKSNVNCHLNEDLQALVGESDFYLTVLAPSVDAPADSVGKLGTLQLELSARRGPDVFRKSSGFWIYINMSETRSAFIYNEWEHRATSDCPGCSLATLQKNGTLHAVYSVISPRSMPDYQLFNALRGKKYTLQLADDVDDLDGRFELNVYLQKCALVRVPQFSDTSKSASQKQSLVVMKHFCGVFHPDKYDAGAESSGVDNLYDYVRRHHAQEAKGSSTMDIVDVQHPDLLPQLRPYQMDAVRWMMRRERVNGFTDSASHMVSAQNALHPLYVEVKLCQGGPTLFFNPYGGYLTEEKPFNCKYSPGGILADEMGLGKTVEVLASILCHPRPKNERPIVDATKGTSSDFGRGNNPDDSLSESVKRESLFECICGSVGNSKPSDESKKERVQCRKCGLWQHASCVKYDSKDNVHASKANYYCPHCWSLMPPIPSRATLIVSPTTIIHQWWDEIKKHVKDKSMKILMYEGVHSGGFIQPPFLADHDIVVMSYMTMRKEIDYVDLPHSNSNQGRKLRHPKRFMAVPSPLVTIDWWRVCLDEAQMVEYSTAKTAEMALRLKAVNRWCITGTPIHKRINDLYGLVLFLRLDPYCVRTWWNECLAKPYFSGHVEPFFKAISAVMWRTSKNDVLDQIDLPPQTEEVHWLLFTPVEEHAYRGKHNLCSLHMASMMNDNNQLDTTLESLDRHLADKWLLPLHHLRKACCHPQVMRGKFQSVRKNIVTMGELLDSLIKKVTVECEEHQRHLVASLNGLAGIHIIKKEWPEAVEKYREVLKSACDLRETIKTDKLQRLHALNNLAEIFDAGHESIRPTEHEANVRQQANNIREEYLKKCFTRVRDSRVVMRQAVDTVDEVNAEFECDKLPWWAAFLVWTARDRKRSKDLATKVWSDINDMANHDLFGVSFSECIGLRFVVGLQLGKLKGYRDELMKAVVELEDHPSADVVDCAVECHLRRNLYPRETPKKCVYCRVNERFNRYESVLFSYEECNSNDETTPDPIGSLRRGTWAAGGIEVILRAALLFARLRDHSANAQGFRDVWLRDGQTEMKLFEALKKEFKALRGVWMQLMDQVSALDELNMANTRLRIKTPSEKPQQAVLHVCEIGPQELKLNSDRAFAANHLKNQLGQLFYLKNLAKSESGKRGGRNPHFCPICQRRLGHQWCVLQCGHCFCEECTGKITHRGSHLKYDSVKCAVCRHVTTGNEVSHVSTMIEASDKIDVDVLGYHSTKVEAIVRKLLQIRVSEPSSKSLVFSMWQDVLDLLGKALKENCVRFCSLQAGNRIQGNLNLFKADPEIGVLLLPYQSGAKGLNLTEATHVVLVEPLMNPATELQAIGRVHRIGQTKPTVVHRFLVRRTIEEHMHSVLTNVRNTWIASSRQTEENPVTFANLLDIVTRASLQQHTEDN